MTTLKPTNVAFSINGTSFEVDAFEATDRLAEIDKAATDEASRWQEVRDYVRDLSGEECSRGQALQFYNRVVEAHDGYLAELAKKNGRSAGSPTGTASTPGPSASASAPPTSPTSQGSTPSDASSPKTTSPPESAT